MCDVTISCIDPGACGFFTEIQRWSHFMSDFSSVVHQVWSGRQQQSPGGESGAERPLQAGHAEGPVQPAARAELRRRRQQPAEDAQGVGFRSSSEVPRGGYGSRGLGWSGVAELGRYPPLAGRAFWNGRLGLGRGWSRLLQTIEAGTNSANTQLMRVGELIFG